MKRLVPILLILCCLPIFGWSQISISVDPVNFVVTGNPSQTDITYHVHIENTGTETINLFWSKRLVSGPTEWWTWICDQTTCYLPETNSCPPQNPNVLAPGGSFDFQMHMNPRNVEGTGLYQAHILDGDGNILETINATVEISQTSSTTNADGSKLSVYPNPTADFFQISGITGLRYVEVYNIVGNKIKSFDAAPQKQYYVGDLNEGIYLVRMSNASKKVLKTVRLSIR